MRFCKMAPGPHRASLGHELKPSDHGNCGLFVGTRSGNVRRGLRYSPFTNAWLHEGCASRGF